MISPTSPPTTAPKTKAIIKKVISRPFKSFAPCPDSKRVGVSSFSLIKVYLKVDTPGYFFPQIGFPFSKKLTID
jgi:hypothetical protein